MDPLLIDTEQPTRKRARIEEPDGVKPSVAQKVPSTGKFPIAEAVEKLEKCGKRSPFPDGMLKKSKRANHSNTGSLQGLRHSQSAITAL